MPSTAESNLAEKLNNLTVKASSITSVADFMLEHRSDDIRMVAVWLDAVKSERRPYQQLNLFYVANEVIKRSVADHPSYISIFGSVFERAMDAAGPNLERVHVIAFGELFRLWQEEQYYGYEYVENLRRHLYSYPSTSQRNCATDKLGSKVVNRKEQNQVCNIKRLQSLGKMGTEDEMEQLMNNISLPDERIRAYIESALDSEKCCSRFLPLWLQTIRKSTSSFPLAAHLFRIVDHLLKMNTPKLPRFQDLLEPFLTSAVKVTVSMHSPEMAQLLERLFYEWESEGRLSSRTVQILRYHLASITTRTKFKANEGHLPGTRCTIEPTGKTKHFEVSSYKDMLNELSRSSSKINRTSEWMIQNGDLCNQIVNQWKNSLFEKPSSEYAIAMLCVAHDVLVKCSGNSAGYIEAFGTALQDSIDFIASVSAPSNYQVIDKCIGMWSRLQLFSPQFITDLNNRIREAFSRKDDRCVNKSETFQVLHPSFDIDSEEMRLSNQSEVQQSVDPKTTLREFVEDLKLSGSRMRELRSWNDHLSKMEKALDKLKKSNLSSPKIRAELKALRAAANKFRVRLDKKSASGSGEPLRYKRMQALLSQIRETRRKEAEHYKEMKQILLCSGKQDGSSIVLLNDAHAVRSGTSEEPAKQIKLAGCIS